MVCGSAGAGAGAAAAQGGGGGLRAPVPGPGHGGGGGGGGAVRSALPAPADTDESNHRWRWIGQKRVRKMSKLDASKVQWIVRQRRNGMPVTEVAETMGVSGRWVKKLTHRYAGVAIDDIVFPQPMGRPRGGLPGRLEESTVLSAYYACVEGSTLLANSIEVLTGLRIPYHIVDAQLKSHGLSRIDPRKSGQRKTARYVKRYSNTMWHADYKLLSDGRWVVSYQDDAARLVTGYGAFERATTANALAVLDVAIRAYGAPLSILTDRGSTFYANESAKRDKGKSQFEKRLEDLGIRHIKARTRHPQTNGKLERLHGEMERKLYLFVESSASRTTRSVGGRPSHVGSPFYTTPASDPVDRFFHWFNFERPNMALDTSKRETPIQAFYRLQPKEGDNVLEDLERSGAYA